MWLSGTISYAHIHSMERKATGFCFVELLFPEDTPHTEGGMTRCKLC